MSYDAGISVALNNLPHLQDLSGLSRLTQIPGDLQLYLLPGITNLNELANLQAVGLNVVIGANANLVSLAGLGKCQRYGSPQQTLQICCDCQLLAATRVVTECLCSLTGTQNSSRCQPPVCQITAVVGAPSSLDLSVRCACWRDAAVIALQVT